eukprot:gene31151-39097_t
MVRQEECPGSCSLHGACSKKLAEPNPTCACFSGFTGERCETRTVDFCLNQCGGRGTCHPPGYCHCDPGYWGAACE